MQNAYDPTEDWAPVHRWHRAVNERDIPEAHRVATPDIVLGGPKGETAGVEIFVEWIERSGIHLDPVSWHPVDEATIVVEQDATWPDSPDADPAAPPVRVATLFRLDGAQVTAALRFEDLHTALTAAT